MKKTDVYVVVDTPKKAKKLKSVLGMFKEDVYRETYLRLSTGSDCDGDGQSDFHYLFIDDDKEWCGHCIKPKNKTKVSIKELRNILAKEHLKEGDYIVCEDDGNVAVGIFKEWEPCFGFDMYNCHYKDGLTSDGGCFNNFIRYATEEEKALLEPKKELEVGKWYKSWNDSYNGYDLSYYTGTGTDYGFHAENNNWFEEQYWIKNLITSEWQEATTQEVEQALIEEAKRRYKVGDKLSLFNGYVYGNGNGIYGDIFDDLSFCIETNALSVKTTNGFYHKVFNNGQWATVIQQDNFTDSDVSIVERLHDTLLDNHGYSLGSKLLTDARILANKIKSNIKQ